MERLLMKNLIDWKLSSRRKPLFLEGVRHVGKTWLLQEFGRRFFTNVAYFDFEKSPHLKDLFESTKNVDRILQSLMMASCERIVPGETLVIFDEVHAAPKALGSLKYFSENAPDLHVACASSLACIPSSEPSSFPVGKVSFLHLHPMCFTEFLHANGDEELVRIIESVNALDPVPEEFFDLLLERLKAYFVTGGMPEAVLKWTRDRDVPAMENALSAILDDYEQDFTAHARRALSSKISGIWNSLPTQLSGENKKFTYQAVREGARAREYEAALDRLACSGLVRKVVRSTSPGLPMAAYDHASAFKAYPADVGILCRLSHLPPSVFAEGSRIFEASHGALLETYVLQTLAMQFEVPARYWSRNNPYCEVEFLIQRENDVLPIEATAGRGKAGRGLRKFNELFPDQVKLLVRFSLDNLNLDDNVLNIPLFMADQADRLIGLALKVRGQTGVVRQ